MRTVDMRNQHTTQSKFCFTHGSLRGTFSQANKAQVMSAMEKRSPTLFQKVNLQKHEIQMAETTSSKMKMDATRSFKNVQKSF